MIIWNGTEWTAPAYTATRTEHFLTDTQDHEGDVSYIENTLTEEQMVRLDVIRYTPMDVEIARHYIMTGMAEIPDNRGTVDKLIDKLLELDPDGESTGSLILDSAVEWRPGEDYSRYAYVKYDEVVYKTIHPIRGRIDRDAPPDAPHLYTRVGAIEGGEIAVEEWRQPTGDHDAYRIGDRVMHNGNLWVCTIGDDAGLNIWEPGTYGWEIVDE